MSAIAVTLLGVVFYLVKNPNSVSSKAPNNLSRRQAFVGEYLDIVGPVIIKEVEKGIGMSLDQAADRLRAEGSYEESMSEQAIELKGMAVRQWRLLQVTKKLGNKATEETRAEIRVKTPATGWPNDVQQRFIRLIDGELLRPYIDPSLP